jgi:hypothetical protein
LTLPVGLGTQFAAVASQIAATGSNQSIAALQAAVPLYTPGGTLPSSVLTTITCNPAVSYASDCVQAQGVTICQTSAYEDSATFGTGSLYFENFGDPFSPQMTICSPDLMMAIYAFQVGSYVTWYQALSSMVAILGTNYERLIATPVLCEYNNLYYGTNLPTYVLSIVAAIFIFLKYAPLLMRPRHRW